VTPAGSAQSEADAREARIIRTVGKVRGMVVARILEFGSHRVSENRTDFLLQTHGGGVRIRRPKAGPPKLWIRVLPGRKQCGRLGPRPVASTSFPNGLDLGLVICDLRFEPAAAERCTVSMPGTAPPWTGIWRQTVFEGAGSFAVAYPKCPYQSARRKVTRISRSSRSLKK
jgi:hypothetical protein